MAMLNWNPRQRALVADKLFDAGNVRAVFDRPGRDWRSSLDDILRLQRRAREEEATMIGIYILLGGMALTMVIIAVLDGIDRRRKHRGAK